MSFKSMMTRAAARASILAVGFAASCALAQGYKAVPGPADSAIDIVAINAIKLFDMDACNSLHVLEASKGLSVTDIVKDSSDPVGETCDIFILHKNVVPLAGKKITLYFGSKVVSLTLSKS